MSFILWFGHEVQDVFEIKVDEIKNLIVHLHCCICRRKVKSSYGLTEH